MRLQTYLVDNKSVGRVSCYTFTNITSDHSISASFSIIKYTITTETNTGGSISPGGKTVVNYGSDLICSISPDYGYRILEVKVDNISIGKVAFLFIQQYHKQS